MADLVERVARAMFDSSCVHDTQNKILTEEIWLELRGSWIKRAEIAIGLVQDHLMGVLNDWKADNADMASNAELALEQAIHAMKGENDD